MHPGIDLAGAYGTPIYATADGTVLRSGWNSGGYGNLVEIDHGRGITTRYGHMSAILVARATTLPRAADRSAWARPAARPATTSTMRCGSTARGEPDPVHEVDRLRARHASAVPAQPRWTQHRRTDLGQR
jgi:hypothetical protein